MIVLVVGDFGVGKDTFANMLLTHFGIDIAQMVRSNTTRPKRYDNEITHQFKTIEEYELEKDDILVESTIGGELYWTTKDQFTPFKNGFSIYVVDEVGANGVQNSDIDDVYTIEVVRPKWLIDLDHERLQRERPEGNYPYVIDYRVINDKTFEYLDRTANDVAKMLRREYMPETMLSDHDINDEYHKYE